MIFIKKLLLFIVCLVPWFLSSLLPADYNYYKTIKLPFFAPPTWFYGIFWTIVYIFIAISIVCVINTYGYKGLSKSYKISLLVNYLFNQSYIITGFILKNNFLGFVSCLGTFISLLFLYNETYIINCKCYKYLIPYFILSAFASILSFTIYIINL